MIPKIIHYAWFSKDPKPPLVAKCLQSWHHYAPGFEVKEWDLTGFPYEKFPFAHEAISVKKWAFATDVFRLWVLNEFGGIYLDSDIELKQPLDNLDLRKDLILGLEFKHRLGAHFIASKPGHPYIADTLEYYANRRFILSNGQYNYVVMPEILTRTYRTSYRRRPAAREDAHHNKLILAENVCSIDALDGSSIAEHCLTGSWKDHKKTKYRALFLRRHNWDQYIDLSLKWPEKSGSMLKYAALLLRYLVSMTLAHFATLLLQKFERRLGVLNLIKP